MVTGAAMTRAWPASSPRPRQRDQVEHGAGEEGQGWGERGSFRHHQSETSRARTESAPSRAGTGVSRLPARR